MVRGVFQGGVVAGVAGVAVVAGVAGVAGVVGVVAGVVAALHKFLLHKCQPKRNPHPKLSGRKGLTTSARISTHLLRAYILTSCARISTGSRHFLRAVAPGGDGVVRGAGQRLWAEGRNLSYPPHVRPLLPSSLDTQTHT